MAKLTKRTKDVRKLSRIFFFVSLCCFVGVAIFTVIATFTRIGGSEKAGIDILSESAKTSLISLSISTVICVILTLFIKEKIRVAVYMLALVINSILFKETGMYIILAIWFIDEYVFTYLHKHYKQLTTINKEIDRRE